MRAGAPEVRGHSAAGGALGPRVDVLEPRHCLGRGPRQDVGVHGRRHLEAGVPGTRTVVARSVPLASSAVAAVWRRSWTRTVGGRPARTSRALKARTTLRASSGVPVWLAKT